MKIAHNKNLTWSSTSGNFSIDRSKWETDFKKIFLIDSERLNKRTLVLIGSTDTNNREVYVRAINIDGEKDLGVLQSGLENCKGRSFNEIRYMDF